jgi:hypothetical protein
MRNVPALGVRGGEFGRGAALQDGTSRVRLPIVVTGSFH